MMRKVNRRVRHIVVSTGFINAPALNKGPKEVEAGDNEAVLWVPLATAMKHGTCNCLRFAGAKVRPDFDAVGHYDLPQLKTFRKLHGSIQPTQHVNIYD